MTQGAENNISKGGKLRKNEGTFRQSLTWHMSRGKIAHPGTGKARHVVEGLDYFLKRRHVFGSQ